MQILPAITTIFNWRDKIKEVKELNLKEVSLFLTCLNPEERENLYRLLKKTGVEKIPFIHLRSDIKKEEIEYLIQNYHAEAFNIHTKKEYPHPSDYKKYKDMIYIENTYKPLDEKEIKEFAGICLDFSHLENSRLLRKNTYRHNTKLIEKYGCGCNHIGPAKKFPVLEKVEVKYPRNRHPHILNSFSELNYLKKYPIRYFGKLVALEIENSIREQLRVRDYIINLLNK